MRRHGRAARRRMIAAFHRANAIKAQVDHFVFMQMWSARVHREVRRGARIVAGPAGEVFRVDAVGSNGYDVHTSSTPFKVDARLGKRWVESDLKAETQPHAYQPKFSYPGYMRYSF